jgi:NADH:ubiquinone oxidoreductase subunit 3 (subunit A)
MIDLVNIGLAGLISLGLGVVLLTISIYLGSIQYLGPVLDKVMAFECGFIAFKDSRAKFNISYYLLGI